MPRNTNTKRKRRVKQVAAEVESSFTTLRKRNKLKHAASSTLFYVDDGAGTAGKKQGDYEKSKQLIVSYDNRKKIAKKVVRNNHNSVSVEPTEDLWGDSPPGT